MSSDSDLFMRNPTVGLRLWTVNHCSDEQSWEQTAEGLHHWSLSGMSASLRLPPSLPGPGDSRRPESSAGPPENRWELANFQQITHHLAQHGLGGTHTKSEDGSGQPIKKHVNWSTVLASLQVAAEYLSKDYYNPFDSGFGCPAWQKAGGCQKGTTLSKPLPILLQQQEQA
jgi:hypothetical protein